MTPRHHIVAWSLIFLLHMYTHTSTPHTYTPHSAGWLYIIDQWLSLSGAIKHDLMSIAAATPDLLPSCLSLLHSEETLG